MFDKLDAESNEEDDDDDNFSVGGRKEMESLELSSEEDEDSKKKTASKLRKQKLQMSRNKGRLGNPDPAKVQTSGGKDPEIEQASIPELKNMLTKLKRQDKGIFSTSLIPNPIALSSSVLSFGTGMFRRVFCGLRPSNNYCVDDTSTLGTGPLFDGFKKALRSMQ